MGIVQEGFKRRIDEVLNYLDTLAIQSPAAFRERFSGLEVLYRNIRPFIKDPENKKKTDVMFNGLRVELNKSINNPQHSNFMEKSSNLEFELRDFAIAKILESEREDELQ